MGMQKFFVMASAGTHAAVDLAAMNDTGLSWKAKALHYFIRTRGEATTNQDGLVTAGPDGRDAVNNGVKELIQRKYLYLTQIREAGKFKYAVYISFPKPVELTAEQLNTLIKEGTFAAPYTGKPDTGNPLHGADSGRLSVSVRNTLLSTSEEVPNKDISYDDAVAKRIEGIFNHWNKQPNLPTHRRGIQYKTYQNCIIHIRKALRDHTTTKIMEAIHTYNRLLGHPYTVLRGKENPDRVGLNEFFKFNKFSDKVRCDSDHHLHNIDSWFVECCRGIGHVKDKFGLVRANKYPATTEVIIAASRDAGILNDNLTPRDMNCTRKAAEMIGAFFELNRDLLPKRMGAPQLARELVRSITGRVHTDNAHSGYLISDITWTNFGAFLAEQGIMERRVSGRQHAQKAAGL